MYPLLLLLQWLSQHFRFMPCLRLCGISHCHFLGKLAHFSTSFLSTSNSSFWWGYRHCALDSLSSRRACSFGISECAAPISVSHCITEISSELDPESKVPFSSPGIARNGCSRQFCADTRGVNTPMS